MQKFISTKAAAEGIGVTETSLDRWFREGYLGEELSRPGKGRPRQIGIDLVGAAISMKLLLTTGISLQDAARGAMGYRQHLKDDGALNELGSDRVRKLLPEGVKVSGRNWPWWALILSYRQIEQEREIEKDPFGGGFFVTINESDDDRVQAEFEGPGTTLTVKVPINLIKKRAEMIVGNGSETI